ncbi:MAG: hypothetical protein ACYDHN_09375 [Solirubrobacteraceae bacterium]
MLLCTSVACACLAMAVGAAASETVALHASFSPDRLGSPTNLSATATFSSTVAGPLSPVTAVTTYGPAGMSLDVRGAGICRAGARRLEALGPGACPGDSRVGFGRATGLLELAGEQIPEPLTLELFLAPRRDGHLTMLIYANAVTPTAQQFVMLATEVHAPRPYGLGVSIAVPTVASLPGASLGWVQSALVTLGAADIAYYRTIHGRRTLVHVKGVTVPRSCPRGGFPLKAGVTFADGTTASPKTTIPCPSR